VKSKYKNDASNVGACPAFRKVLKFVMAISDGTGLEIWSESG